MADEDIDRKVEAVLSVIDTAGAPPLPKPDYVAFMDKIIEQCKTRRDATQEEIDNEDIDYPF